MAIYMTIEDEERSALDVVYNERLPVQTGGKRQHGKLTIVHRVDQPGMVQGLSPNQILPIVKLEFSRRGQNAREKVYYTVTLTNARIVSINPHQDESKRDVAFEYEKIDFSYKQIMVNWKNGATITKDDWT